MMTRAKQFRDSALEPNPASAAGFEKHGTGSRAIGLAESGLVPDWMIRAGIRRLNRQRLAEIKVQDREAAAESLNAFAASMAVAEVAPVPHKANEQHYEVPPEFFQLVLGEHRKYSCAYWPGQVGLLDEAEEEALRLTCEHAGIVDGMVFEIAGHRFAAVDHCLELLGCGDLFSAAPGATFLLSQVHQDDVRRSAAFLSLDANVSVVPVPNVEATPEEAPADVAGCVPGISAP